MTTQFTIIKKIAKHGKQAIIVIPKIIEDQLKPGTIVELKIEIIDQELEGAENKMIEEQTRLITSISDENLKEMLRKGELRRFLSDDISVRFELAIEVGRDYQPFRQEEIDRIKLPAYIPENLLKCEKWGWSEAPHDYYKVGGTRYINPSTITGHGLDLNDFIKALDERSGKRVSFQGRRPKIIISLDSLMWGGFGGVLAIGAIHLKQNMINKQTPRRGYLNASKSIKLNRVQSMTNMEQTRSNKRIALVYPPVSEKCAPMRDLGLVPPTHLLALAAYVGGDIAIYDGAHNSLDSIVQRLQDSNPDVIGMNVDLTNYDNAVRIADETKGRVILGGNYAAFLAKQILTNQPRVEAVCYNDGEQALKGFIEGDLSVPNLVHRNGKNSVISPDITTHPTPAYDLVDMNVYFKRQEEIFGKGFKMMQFYGQKGCTNTPHCTFCGRYEDGLRLRDPEIYSDEVKKYVKKFGLTEVWDRSDSFLQSKKWFGAIHLMLKGLPVSFKTYARADQLTPENIKMLKEMNFRMVYIGYEAGDDSLLRAMNKRETTTQYLDATKRVLDSGIDVDASFIIGLPGENERTLENQVLFVEKLSGLGLKKIKVNRVLVLPGTPLYDRVCDKYPEVRKLDSLDIADMQRKIYSTYNLSDFGGVDRFVERIDSTATLMTDIILKRGGCIEGYGCDKRVIAGGQESIRR